MVWYGVNIIIQQTNKQNEHQSFFSYNVLATKIYKKYKEKKRATRETKKGTGEKNIGKKSTRKRTIVF